MPRFSIRNPYFIVVVCLVLLVIGVTALARMPVDLFPTINLPEVVVATFYSGMPPQDIEIDITDPLERFFTLGGGIDHMESRSMMGVSLIRVYFQPGSNADADVSEISNLALADLKRLPPGTLPPVVMKFDPSSLPVCLITLKGQGLNQTQLHDIGQFTIRNQIISEVQGAGFPPPFGGKYRQIMIYVDPYKLFSRQLSPMDVVNAVNQSNLILPAGDVKLGPFDYYLYSNSLVDNMQELNQVPIKTVGNSWVTVGDVGQAEDASQIQYNMVRVDGQRSVYLPVMKQGGDSNTITVVNQVRAAVAKLYDVPKQLVANVVFDQSAFVKESVATVLHEGLIGLLLTSLMILIFLGSLRATVAVCLSIPLAALATFVVLNQMGSTVNTMILGGLALALSRIIDNSVISLENIYRHLETGAAPEAAAESGGNEVNLAVLAATLTTVVVFFPVTFLYGVSKFLFSALALAVVISLFASYFVAMTVIPLFCSRFLKPGEHAHDTGGHTGATAHESVPRRAAWPARFHAGFNRGFHHLLAGYERSVRRAVARPRLTVVVLMALFVASLGLYPFLGVAFFPRTDAGQFTVTLKAPTGTRLEDTEQYVARVEQLARRITGADFGIVVSNLGVVPDYSALYTTNSAAYTASVQVQLKEGHKTGTFTYMDAMTHDLATQDPDLRAFVSSGSMVDAILNSGMPAPIDVQVAGKDLNAGFGFAQTLAKKIHALHGVGEVYIPQDLDYPAIRLDVDRVHAAELGLTQKDIVDNVITALNSNTMIAPNYWVDRNTGNDYYLTVQYYENGGAAVHNRLDLTNIPLRAPNLKQPTTLDSVVKLDRMLTPTEVDHYASARVTDIYVTPAGEDLGRVANAIDAILAQSPPPAGVRVTLRGMVQGMRASFRSFAIGLGLALVLLYLILVAQFRSFKDPVLILLAIPMGFIGVMIGLPLTGTTLNVMSLMGVLMLVGIAASNSILIVEFAHRLRESGETVANSVIASCRVRLRPILMTSLATIIGLLPMALKMGTGSEQYAPLACAIIAGLTVSVLLTVFIVPAAFIWVYDHD